MGREYCTISDLAKKTGFAKSTVSAAMNGRSGVGEDARKKILHCAEEMNYVANENARSISSNSYNTIGVIVRDITNPFYAKVCRAIESIAEEQGYSLIIQNTDADGARLKNAIKLLYAKRVSGLIVDANDNNEEIEEFLCSKNINYVLFGMNSIRSDSVETDDVKGAYLAATHIYNMGHKNIVYVGAGRNNVYSKNRILGIEQALHGKDVRFETIKVNHNLATVDSGYQIFDKILQTDATAVIAFNDLIAVGVMRRCMELHINIPNKLSIIGFDNIESVGAPLDTIDIPEYSMGQNAAKLLFKRIKNTQKETEHILLGAKLIVRGSVKDMNKI